MDSGCQHTSGTGHTPLVKLNKVVGPESDDVFVKLEYYNPTGSCKDRMALAKRL
ncbi:pyridoxal-phosphate dependent enzyme [Spirosoma flavus]